MSASGPATRLDNLSLNCNYYGAVKLSWDGLRQVRQAGALTTNINVDESRLKHCYIEHHQLWKIGDLPIARGLPP